jgi:addiction module HigA family antidote
MPMKNPPHPGDLIRTEIIEALGLSVSKAAEILKVRRATLSDLLHGKAALTPEMALRIEKAFGPDMNHLLRMQLAYDVAKTRQHARDIAVKRYVPAVAAIPREHDQFSVPRTMISASPAFAPCAWSIRNTTECTVFAGNLIRLRGASRRQRINPNRAAVIERQGTAHNVVRRVWEIVEIHPQDGRRSAPV